MKEKLKYLDPFFYVDNYLMPLVNPEGNNTKEFVVHLVSAFVFAWLFLFILGLILGTGMPVSVVMSGSMEPVLHRGDIIFLQGVDNVLAGQKIEVEKYIGGKGFSEIGEIEYDNEMQAQAINIEGERIEVLKEGDIIVYWSDLRHKSIIHRAVLEIESLDGTYYLTKGDSYLNNTIDQDCGLIINGKPKKSCITLYPIAEDKVEGKVVFVIPYLGCAKIWLTDNLFYLLLNGRLPSDYAGYC